MFFLILCCIVRRYQRATEITNQFSLNGKLTVTIVRRRSMLCGNACRNQQQLLLKVQPFALTTDLQRSQIKNHTAS